MRTVHFQAGLKIDLDGRWIYVNDKKWGHIVGGGIYCHRDRVERFARELGFHAPAHLLNHRITWEVQVKDGVYTTWTYLPTEKQRMRVTAPMIFISCARLVWIKDAPHVVKPRK
jgi:hypothetical protein